MKGILSFVLFLALGSLSGVVIGTAIPVLAAIGIIATPFVLPFMLIGAHMQRVKLEKLFKNSLQMDTKVLLVEDDVDYAIFLKSLFEDLGCNVDWVRGSTRGDARKMAGSNYDLVVMDWQLGTKTADRFLHLANRIFERTQPETKEAKLVTISASKQNNMRVPQHSSLYNYLGHWDKWADYSSLKSRASVTLATA